MKRNSYTSAKSSSLTYSITEDFKGPVFSDPNNTYLCFPCKKQKIIISITTRSRLPRIIWVRHLSQLRVIQGVRIK